MPTEALLDLLRFVDIPAILAALVFIFRLGKIAEAIDLKLDYLTHDLEIVKCEHKDCLQNCISHRQAHYFIKNNDVFKFLHPHNQDNT